MKVVVSGGGTGGHITPALAIIDELKSRWPDVRVLFVGRRNSLEQEMARRASVQFAAVCAAGWRRERPVRNIAVSARLALGLGQAFLVLARFRPEAVVGMGGFVSLPTSLMASWMNIPTLVHEQNLRPGLANKLCGRFARAVAVSYEDSEQFFPKDKTFLTGNPVRSQVLSAESEGARGTWGLTDDRFTVLVTGGSQGAHSINMAVVDSFKFLEEERFQFLFMTGELDFSQVKEQCEKAEVLVHVEPFIYDMASAYACADLVVCRAGSSTLAEITAHGLPAVLVPYPHATDNHQEINARSLVDSGAAEMIMDRDLSGETIAHLIERLEADRSKLARMSEAAGKLGDPEAARKVVDVLVNITSQ